MADRHPLDRLAATTLSRRALLRAAAFGGVAAFLAACGSSTTPSPSASSVAATTSPPSPTPRPTGSPAQQASPAPSSVAASASPVATPTPGPSLREKIAGLLIVGFRGSRLEQTPWVRSALATQGLGGVILFDRDQLTGGHRNVLSPDQVRTLVGDIRTAAGQRRIIASVDQEGGIVTRLSPAYSFPPLASEADIGRGTAAQARTWARLMAGTLSDNGFNLNFAPVVDLDVNPRSPAIGALDRSFSADPNVVVRMATI